MMKVMNYSNKMRIRDWAVEDRPREKLMQKGVTALSNAELIAILIGSGTKEESAVELSRRLLRDADDDLNELGKKNLHDLTKLKGIGEARAISIMAALELVRLRSGMSHRS
ncbi:MAG: UPF0758 domain-containing protein, partial [Bacteroidota bacterium]